MERPLEVREQRRLVAPPLVCRRHRLMCQRWLVTALATPSVRTLSCCPTKQLVWRDQCVVPRQATPLVEMPFLFLALCRRQQRCLCAVPQHMHWLLG